MEPEATDFSTPTTRRVLLTSFFVDVLDVVMNLAIALFTGSVVMLAETLEGFADMCSAGLLLVGFKKSNRRPNRLHPCSRAGYDDKEPGIAPGSFLLIL